MPLLKDRRPRTEWKYEDLASEVELMKPGRNFGNGKAMFKVANCIACHKLDGEGNDFGPDLAKLDLKLKVARHLEGHRRAVASASTRNTRPGCSRPKAGKTHTGLILEENAASRSS